MKCVPFCVQCMPCCSQAVSKLPIFNPSIVAVSKHILPKDIYARSAHESIPINIFVGWSSLTTLFCGFSSGFSLALSCNVRSPDWIAVWLALRQNKDGCPQCMCSKMADILCIMCILWIFLIVRDFKRGRKTGSFTEVICLFVCTHQWP